jgi:hypothetical protein
MSFSRTMKAKGELGAFHSGAPGALRAFCKRSSFTARTVVGPSTLIAKETGPEFRMDECNRARTMSLESIGALRETLCDAELPFQISDRVIFVGIAMLCIASVRLRLLQATSSAAAARTRRKRNVLQAHATAVALEQQYLQHRRQWNHGIHSPMAAGRANTAAYPAVTYSLDIYRISVFTPVFSLLPSCYSPGVVTFACV